MVWKFGSNAAAERHATLIGRIELTRAHPEPTEERMATPAPDAARVDRFEKAGFTREYSPATLAPVSFDETAPLPASVPQSSRDGRIEPVFLQKVDSPPAPVVTKEVSAPEAYSLPQPAGDQYLEAPPELIILDNVAFELPLTPIGLPEEQTTAALSWDVPAFIGEPDELPDLRPVPPPPLAHPGLQFRNANTFGHSLRLPAEDERQALWTEQRRTRGFDDTELWGLDDAIARFVLPRLKALRQQKLDTPSKAMEQSVWYALIDKMILAFELLLPEGGGAWSRGALTDRERAQVQEGLDLFRKYFFSLCW